MPSIADQLHTLGALMKTNLERKGVTGLTTSMGLTTLANKILDIDCQGGGGDGLYLSGSSSIIQIDETCTLNAVLLSNNTPVENEVVVLYSNKDSPITTGMDATNFELKFGSVDAQVLFNDIIPNRVLVDYEASNNLITIRHSYESEPYEAMRGTVLYKVGNTFFTDWGYSITVPSSLNILNVYKIRGIQANDFTSIIGGGFTNIGGVVTADYVGTGAGDVIVYAKCNLNGSLLQETYVLYDCLMKDIGTSANPTNIYTDTTYLNRTSEYTQITDNGTGTTFILTNIFSGDICIELDSYVNVADSNPVFAITNGGIVINQLTQENLSLPDNTWIHYKIQIKDNNIVWSTDYNSQTKNGSLTTYNRFRLRKGVGETLNYKNLMIYPI